MTSQPSPLDLNLAWMQGLIDAVWINPFRDPIPPCPYEKDSDLAELWHYGAQYAMAREGVTIDGFDGDTGEMPTVSESVMKMMAKMNQEKGQQP